MKLTKAQLERIFALYDGFGWHPGHTPPEITPVADGGDGLTIAVALCGYVIYVNHMGQAIPVARTLQREPRAA